jgi:uroporphyrinogen-III decarboxylase
LSVDFDPSEFLARGSTGEVRSMTRELISCWKAGGWSILNASCAIPAFTPAENIRAIPQTAHEESIYDKP